MTELVRGVTWPGRRPLLGLLGVDSAQSRTLELTDATLTYRIVGTAGRIYCVGRRGATGEHIPCPQARAAVSGKQCEECASKDPFRFVHVVHRQNFVSKDIEAVVMQPHWLYVATFADGVSKIGTAVERRKWGRLTEQGALVGRYVARAGDGRVVRDMEDAVTAEVGLQQGVRAAAKASALTRPVDMAALDEINRDAAFQARELLSGSGFDGEFTVIDEVWDPPTGRDALLGADERAPYPVDATHGAHGFTVDAMIGSTALVRVPAEPVAAYVLDLSRLAGRRIMFGDYRTSMPAVQGALF